MDDRDDDVEPLRGPLLLCFSRAALGGMQDVGSAARDQLLHLAGRARMPLLRGAATALAAHPGESFHVGAGELPHDHRGP